MMPDSFFALVLRRIAWRHAVPWLIRGLAAGAVVAALVLLIARVVPLENRAWWALGAGVALAMAARAATHARLTHAATRVAQAQHAGALPRATLATLPKADRLRQQQLARVLARLQHQLAAARTPAQALKAIAQAQDALKHLA